MRDLVHLVQEAHGGLENWSQVRGITLVASMTGPLARTDNQQDGLRAAHVFIDSKKPGVVIWPFPQRGTRGFFTASKLRLQSDSGQRGDETVMPTDRTGAQSLPTPPADLQLLEFMGSTFWHQFVAPFLFSYDGVRSEEGEKHQEHGQTWRTLSVTFPPDLAFRTRTHRYYFDVDGHLRRHDYYVPGIKRQVAEYLYDERLFDRFLFPTRARVVSMDGQQQPLLYGPASVWIDVESAFVHRNYL